jgi:hypothetical protein
MKRKKIIVERGEYSTEYSSLKQALHMNPVDASYTRVYWHLRTLGQYTELSKLLTFKFL